MSEQQSCLWCGAPAEFLCDFRVKGEGPVMATCDAPFCRAHRYRHSSGIACTRGKGGGCKTYSIDYCPDHAPKPVTSPAAA